MQAHQQRPIARILSHAKSTTVRRDANRMGGASRKSIRIDAATDYRTTDWAAAPPSPSPSSPIDACWNDRRASGRGQPTVTNAGPTHPVNRTISLRAGRLHATATSYRSVGRLACPLFRNRPDNGGCKEDRPNRPSVVRWSAAQTRLSIRDAW
jgi:hypothetical protein